MLSAHNSPYADSYFSNLTNTKVFGITYVQQEEMFIVVFCRAKAAAMGVCGVDDPHGVSPGTYVAVHLAQMPADVAVKLLHRVQSFSQVSIILSLFLFGLPLHLT